MPTPALAPALALELLELVALDHGRAGSCGEYGSVLLGCECDWCVWECEWDWD